MENASKALIIAGAILLSILIISLGLMVYNNSKNTVNNASLDEQEIGVFNSKWESYLGTGKTASEVQTMISAMIASNAAESKKGTGRYVSLTPNSTKAVTKAVTAMPSISYTNLSTSKTYTVSIGVDTATGLVVGLAYN